MHAGTDESSVLVALVYLDRPLQSKGALDKEQYHIFAHPPSYPVLDWMNSVTNPTADFQKLHERSREPLMHEHEHENENGTPHADQGATNPPLPGGSGRSSKLSPPVLSLADALLHSAGLKDEEAPFISRIASTAGGLVGGMHGSYQWLLECIVHVKNLVPPDMLPTVLLCGAVLLLVMLQRIFRPKREQYVTASTVRPRGPTAQSHSSKALRRPAPSLCSVDVGAVARHFISGDHRKDVRTALASLLKDCPHVTLVGEKRYGGSVRDNGGRRGGGEQGGPELGNLGDTKTRNMGEKFGVSGGGLGGNGNAVRRVFLVVNPADEVEVGTLKEKGGGAGGVWGWLFDGARCLFRFLVSRVRAVEVEQGSGQRAQQGTESPTAALQRLGAVLCLY